MKASELIEELARQIRYVGDRDVYIPYGPGQNEVRPTGAVKGYMRLNLPSVFVIEPKEPC